MNTNKIVKALCLVALFGSFGSVQAQEDKSKDKSVSREMTLEREYDPTVQDASKVNTLPVIKEPTVTKRAIDYSNFTLPADPGKEIFLLPSGNIQTELKYDNRRGYLNFGIGNYLNIDGDFGYHILNDDINKLNIYYSHRSTNGDVKYLQEDAKFKQKINDNLGGINFRHTFDKLTLKLGAQYGYSSFNYFGYTPPDGYLTGWDVVTPYTKDKNQGNQTVGVNFGVESNEGAEVGYLLGVDYINFSQKYGFSEEYDGTSENKVTLNAGMNALFGGSQRVGVLAKIDYFHFNEPKDPLGAKYTLGDSHLEATLHPYYRVEGDGWNLKLGVNAMIITGDDDHIFFSPNVAFDVKASETTVFYVTADGKINSNTPYELSFLNRYANPFAVATTSRTWLDGTIGLRSNVGAGFWFDVFAGYKATDDDLFFLPGDNGFGNIGTFFQTDANAVKVGASLKYNYMQMLEFSLKGTYTKWSVDGSYPYHYPPSSEMISEFTDLKAYGRPDFELNFGIQLTPIEPLTFNIDYYLGTGRYTLLDASLLSGADMTVPETALSPANMKLDDIHDVSVKASWAFNKNFSVFAKVNNLLFQKYDLYYGYPAQRLNAMVGFAVTF